MRRILFQLMVTVDGYYSGPEGEVDWHVVDDEFQRYSVECLESVDTLLFGRTTYEMMEKYWTSEEAKAADPIVSGYMNDLDKVVVSTTLGTAQWKNTILINENAEEEIRKLKNKPGKDIAMLGSATLAASLAKHNLIDEYRIIVNPVVLGGGRSFFQKNKKELQLLESRSFQSGNVLLAYGEPQRRKE